MKLFITVIKIAAILLLASGAITILATILGILDTALIVNFFQQLTEIQIPFEIFINFPNVWVVIGYFIFKNIVIFGIDILKRKVSE
jgi:uncharacterized membrane protein